MGSLKTATFSHSRNCLPQPALQVWEDAESGANRTVKKPSRAEKSLCQTPKHAVLNHIQIAAS